MSAPAGMRHPEGAERVRRPDKAELDAAVPVAPPVIRLAVEDLQPARVHRGE